MKNHPVYKYSCTGLLVLLLMCIPMRPAAAPVPLLVMEVIKAGVKKAIRAIDLKMQRLQNKTLWLQNAQKVLENALSKQKLAEISEWTERQKELYQDYYAELSKVKSLISSYQRIREASSQQLLLLTEYKRAWALFQQDVHFSTPEREYMSLVYAGILGESVKNMDELLMILGEFRVQMSDAKRLDIIRSAAKKVDMNFQDLILFNQQNSLLSLRRAKDQHDIDRLKRVHELQPD